MGWSETVAAYRFLDNDSIDWRALMAPHWQQTQRRMAAYPVILCLEDTTELNFNGQATKGLGPLSYEAQRGMHMHPTYAVTPEREQRFEERRIWARAKELGIESGVAGALSVIPQILIAFIVRMPAFVLAMIRESTLSVVRCVRIMASSDANKLDSIGVILAGTASAVVSVYVGHVVSKAVMAVPLLKTFDRQVSGVFAGLLVTAVPLTAIYTFDQNKRKLQFILKKFA